ncbi:right-handed parallel beta-helix repeat-containing protein [Streptomyces wuyuanensis]|uniref:hypothetical protein n=1 Tax=Streptomyces wuyuanensis TaxID=1196353 RepID=UPI00369FBFFD
MSELQSSTRRGPERATALGRTWRLAAVAAAGLAVSAPHVAAAQTVDAPVRAKTERAVAPPATGQHRQSTAHCRDGECRDDDPGRGDRPGDGRGDRRTVRVPCDTEALIAAITEANTRTDRKLSLAGRCTYTLTVNQGGSGNGLPRIVQPITIDGNGATITRDPGAPDFRILQIADGGDLDLSDVTISGGRNPNSEDGAGILVEEAGRLLLEKVTLSGNTATNADGAGLYNQGITAVRDSTVTGNSTNRDGGGVYNYYAKLTITKTRITENTAEDGGGLYTDSGAVTVTGTRFERNSATVDGGAIHQSDGSVDINDSVVSWNTAGGRGGAILHNNEGLHVRTSRITDNTAGGNGGGLSLNAPAVIEDTLIQRNTATQGNGGGIHVATSGTEEVSIRRSKITLNRAPGVGFSGGGIYISPTSLVTLTDAVITRNTSHTAPGGINNQGVVTAYGTNEITDNSPTNCAGSANPVPGCAG